MDQKTCQLLMDTIGSDYRELCGVMRTCHEHGWYLYGADHTKGPWSNAEYSAFNRGMDMGQFCLESLYTSVCMYIEAATSLDSNAFVDYCRKVWGLTPMEKEGTKDD